MRLMRFKLVLRVGEGGGEAFCLQGTVDSVWKQDWPLGCVWEEEGRDGDWRNGRYEWHLVGIFQGHCWTSCNTHNTPQQGTVTQHKIWIVLRLKTGSTPLYGTYTILESFSKNKFSLVLIWISIGLKAQLLPVVLSSRILIVSQKRHLNF